ncbi:MAG: hypothetical protein Q7V57_18040 [Actinomycetota bacterium]|nr:hypothetical protein [Actinomycetota bacterium]
MQRRFILLIAVLTVLAPPAAAAADAPGPTDYQSSIIGIDPPTPTIHPSVVGGDSFLLLTVDRGTTVEVSGYQGEEFLRYEADGDVFENRASATYAASKSRYDGSLPEGFDLDAPADWQRVSTDGSYAWHDHRIHWMTDIRPPGKRPGDVVLRSKLAMVVDGAPVEITVESVWMPSASTAPGWVGAVVGLGAAMLVGLGTRWRWAGLALVDVAVLATVVGWWQYDSFPPSAWPRPIWFALPLVAALAAVAAVAVRSVLTRAALTAVAGVNLLWWGYDRRSGFSSAILPTNAPGWLDRFASGAALACGPVVALFALAALVRAVVRPTSAT